MKEVQISAYISEETKELFDHEVRMSGRKKGFLVEEALRHHLVALRSLPLDVITRPRLVVSRRSGEAIVERLEKPAPTPALRKLMRSRGNQTPSR